MQSAKRYEKRRHGSDVHGPLAVALVGLLATPAWAAFPVDVRAVTGDAAGGGRLVAVDRPSINDAGQVGFRGEFAEGDSGDSLPALFLSDPLGGPLGGLTLVARRGQSVVGAPGSILTGFDSFVGVGPAGELVTRGSLSGPSELAVLRADPAAGVRVVGADADPTLVVSVLTRPTVNGNGAIAFGARAAETFGDRGVYFQPPDGPLARLVVDGDTLASGEVITAISTPSIRLSDRGSVSFTANFRPPRGVPTIPDGVFLRNADGLAGVALVGQPTPEGDLVFTDFQQPPELNERDQIAFSAALGPDIRGPVVEEGVFFFDPQDGLSAIARVGDELSDGSTITDLGGLPVLPGTSAPVNLNDRGEVAFRAGVDGFGVLNEFLGGGGVFRGTPAGLTEIALTGQEAPGGGEFVLFTDPLLNDRGQTAFTSFVRDDNGELEIGLFAFDDDLGLVELLRSGDPLAGSAVVDINLASVEFTPFDLSDDRDGINDAGQVAVRFVLADGREGVAVVAVPEPAGLAAVAVAGLGLVRRRVVT